MGLRKTSRDAAHRATTRGGLPPQAFVRTQSLSSKMTANLDWRDKFVPTEVSEAPQGSPKKKVFNMRATSGAGKYSLEVPFVRQINYSQTLTPSQLHRPAVPSADAVGRAALHGDACHLRSESTVFFKSF